jgi:hypothetical protein
VTSTTLVEPRQATTAEDGYDYAGQDPINGYDLNGAKPDYEGGQSVDLEQRAVVNCEYGNVAAQASFCPQLSAWSNNTPSHVEVTVTVGRSVYGFALGSGGVRGITGTASGRGWSFTASVSPGRVDTGARTTLNFNFCYDSFCQTKSVVVNPKTGEINRPVSTSIALPPHNGLSVDSSILYYWKP